MGNTSKDKRHGDDKLMIRARHDFLSRGYYNCLLDTLVEIVCSCFKPFEYILDIGCGDCWYTSNILRCMGFSGKPSNMLAIDISKAALEIGASACKEAELAVASAFSLPVSDSFCQTALSIFAPFSGAEVFRVLKKGGYFIRVYPLKNHLYSLKCAIYDRPYYNGPLNLEISGLHIERSHEISSTICIDNSADIINLFAMTPYYYKTSRADQEKLSLINSLETELHFGITVYRK